MTPYTARQFCRFVRESGGTRIYAFCLYVGCTRQALNDVSSVEYTLHESSPDPVRRSHDRAHAFALQSEGWSSFTALIRISTIAGTVFQLEHEVILQEDAWPMGPRPVEFASASEQSTYNALLDSGYQWITATTLAERADLGLEDVALALRDLEGKQAVRNAYYTSFVGEELWGATCVIGLLPSPATS